MTRTRAILAATSIATAAALALAACDGGDTPASPSPEPSASSAAPSASPSPSATSVVVPPERPKAMDDDGPAGAEAAAVYFLELDDYIMKTGDTAEWEAMSHKSCKHCAARLDQARQISEQGDVFTGGERTASVLHTYEQDAATGIWPLDVHVEEKASRITDASGDVLLDNKAQAKNLRVELARKGDKWTVIGVAGIPE